MHIYTVNEEYICEKCFQEFPTTISCKNHQKTCNICL